MLLPSWIAFVVQACLLALSLAVVLYVRFDRRHVVTMAVPRPAVGGRAGGPATAQVDFTTWDPHRVSVAMLWLLFAQQAVHFADLFTGTPDDGAVAAFLSATFIVVLFAHVLFVGLRGFYFNVRALVPRARGRPVPTWPGRAAPRRC